MMRNGKEDKKGRKPPPDPGDSSSDDEGKGKRRSGPRRSSLFITPETYQEPENARQITPKCEVALFKRGTDMTIENWVMQMEAYFTLAKIPMDSFAGFMLTKIDSLHFTEVLTSNGKEAQLLQVPRSTLQNLRSTRCDPRVHSRIESNSAGTR